MKSSHLDKLFSKNIKISSTICSEKYSLSKKPLKIASSFRKNSTSNEFIP